MKHLLIGVTTMTILCAGMLVMTRLEGGQNKSLGAVILAASRCDPEPCWQGLRPGATRFNQVLADLRSRGAILLTASDAAPCWYMPSAPLWLSCASKVSSDSSAPLDYIDVKLPPGDLRLGDAVLQFGEPISLGFCPVVNSQLPNLPLHFISAFISFHNGIAMLAYNPLHLEYGKGMMDPNMIVWRMYYGIPPQEGLPDYAWYGFSQRSAQDQWCIRG